MSQFRKRPVVVEAVQYVGGNDAAIIQWMEESSADAGTRPAPYLTAECKLAIPTLVGTVTASYGDWVIRGVVGEFYPCKPDVFEATYEPVQLSYAGRAPHVETIGGVAIGFDSKEKADAYRAFRQGVLVGVGLLPLAGLQQEPVHVAVERVLDQYRTGALPEVD